ncbi:hypothetical protein EMG21_27685 [Klebsiella pneumoniae]|nr:hypothetical protein EMG21_27685 [Klebsiella pneumoniae]
MGVGMDPNVVLEERILKQIKLMEGIDSVESLADLADDLIDAVVTLDEWLRKGGVLPERWQVMR